ncbi:Hsp20/alpha crystallin family protein [Halobacillus sp. K22]|uniref:Hsp20/alpha crystallin family protein n=1 Tax=Halobacillus sp. K22 TaxID=3457431 RepID=UPI003FCDFF86
MGQQNDQFPKLFNDAFQKVVRSMDSYFSQSIKQLGQFLHENTFPVAMQEINGEVIIQAQLPEADRSQIEVEVIGNHIRIAVKHTEMTEFITDHNHQYQKQQTRQMMERTVTLPFTISEKETNAQFNNGILTIKTPKRSTSSEYIDII